MPGRLPSPSVSSVLPLPAASNNPVKPVDPLAKQCASVPNSAGNGTFQRTPGLPAAHAQEAWPRGASPGLIKGRTRPVQFPQDFFANRKEGGRTEGRRKDGRRKEGLEEKEASKPPRDVQVGGALSVLAFEQANAFKLQKV